MAKLLNKDRKPPKALNKKHLNSNDVSEVKYDSNPLSDSKISTE